MIPKLWLIPTNILMPWYPLFSYHALNPCDTKHKLSQVILLLSASTCFGSPTVSAFRSQPRFPATTRGKIDPNAWQEHWQSQDNRASLRLLALSLRCLDSLRNVVVSQTTFTERTAPYSSNGDYFPISGVV